jgi:hypothetical protein
VRFGGSADEFDCESFTKAVARTKTWMAGTNPAMTFED